MDTKNNTDFTHGIQQSLKQVATKTVRGLDELKLAYTEFLTAVFDSVKAREQYLDIVERYEQGTESETLPAPSFLSVEPHTPVAVDVAEDAEAVEELANTVAEIEKQLEFLEQRVQQSLRTITTDVATTVAQAAQLDAYLEQQISELDSVYGSPTMPGTAS